MVNINDISFQTKNQPLKMYSSSVQYTLIIVVI